MSCLVRAGASSFSEDPRKILPWFTSNCITFVNTFQDGKLIRLLLNKTTEGMIFLQGITEFFLSANDEVPGKRYSSSGKKVTPGRSFRSASLVTSLASRVWAVA